MTQPSPHLEHWTLDALAEGTLPHRERTLAEAHLRACPPCAAELEAARAVQAALSSLPRFAPSPALADAVMARVAVQPARAASAVRRWLPQTRRGWMMLWTAILVPAAPLVPLFAWLFSHPGVTPGALWGMGKTWAVETAWAGVVRAAEALLRSGAARWVVTEGGAFPGGYAGLAAALALFLIAIPVSGWVIVRLLRAPSTGMSHA